MKHKYTYSFCLEGWDEETDFRGNFDSIIEALEGADEYCDKIGTKCYIGENIPAPMPTIDVEKLFDDINSRYYDEYGELAEDYFAFVKKEDADILSKELNAVFARWIKKYHYAPWFYTVTNVREYVFDGEKWQEGERKW